MPAHDEPILPRLPDRAVRAEIARAWAAELDLTAYVARSVAQIEADLLELVDLLFEAAVQGPVDGPRYEQLATRVGTRLVELRFTGPDSLPCSIEVLAQALLVNATGQVDQLRAEQVVMLLTAVAAGYGSSIRLATLDQQEAVNKALLNAHDRVERQLRATENRFREVFNSSAIGIAITDLDGVFIEVNPALAEIVACDAQELAGRRLHEFLADLNGAGTLVEVGRAVLGDDRVRQRRELIRANGETAWVYLATSLLRDGSGEPTHQVTMVQDLSELQLLQDRLGHQLTHDALTGLPNRQSFVSNVEGTLAQLPPAASVTLCCVGLDSFALVNSAHGHEVGDALLRGIAERLHQVLAGEQALLARTGGDEFSVLIEHSESTPDIPELVEQINTELIEPTYLDGNGVGIGASVGVVKAMAGATTGAELFRAADVALRTAKATGRRQWVQYDPHLDAAFRASDLLAIELAAAAENGELTVGYEPVIRLSDGEPVGAHAVLVWQGALVPPRECFELAERTGLSIPLARQIMTCAAKRLPVLHTLFQANQERPAPVLRLWLSRLQCADADLSAAVNTALRDTGMAPGLLEIAFDTGALLDDTGDAQDNLQVLNDIGVVTALHGFTGGSRELDLLERSAVGSVVLHNPVTGTVFAPPGPMTTAAITRLVAELLDAGIRVGVDGVRDDTEVRWWYGVGVRTATGPVFGTPAAADDLADRFVTE